MQHLTKSTIKELMKINAPVCLSLYMPTHRAFPQRNENPILFKNLLRQLKEQLELKRPDADHDSLMQPFKLLQDDEQFWQHQQSSLAIFAGAGFFKVYTLAQPVAAGTAVCNHPHLTPLIRITQAAGNYQVLCLTRDNIRLFEGNRDTLNEITLHAAVPATKEQALGDQLTPADQTGFTQGFSSAGERGHASAHESAGAGKQEEIDIDRQRYFRAVDKAITEHYSRPSALPLILVALPENQAFFRAVSHNPYLQDKGVTVDLSNLDTEHLRQQCWQLMSALYSEKMDSILQHYQQSHSQGLASNEFTEIEQAAETGRIATLLVEDDRLNITQINQQPPADKASFATAGHAEALEELALTVMQNGGDVFIVPPQRIPGQTRAAAVYRF